MKFPQLPTTPTTRPQAESRATPLGHPVTAVPRDNAHFSAIGQTVTELQRNAHTQRLSVRPEVIAQIRQEMIEGTFGGPTDIENTLNELLRIL